MPAPTRALRDVNFQTTLIGVLNTDFSTPVCAAIDASGNLQVGGTVTASNPSVGSTGSAIPASATLLGGSDGTNLQPLQVDASKNLKVLIENTSLAVTGTFWQATQPVSGTVTANAGTNLNTSALALDTTVSGLEVAQASTTSGQKGILTQGAVTTSAPTYTTAQTSPLSLTTGGLLRVDGSGVTQSVSGTFWQTTQPVSLASLPALATGTNSIGAVTGQAIGSAVPANAFYEAGLAKTVLPTAATDGNLTGQMMDKFGRSVSVLGTVRDLRGTQTTTISASITETTIVTAGAAGVFNDLIMIIVANTSASTNTRIDFRDATTGTVIFPLQVPGNTTLGFAIPGSSIPQTTAANNWTAQCATSTTDIRITAIYEKNK